MEIKFTCPACRMKNAIYDPKVGMIICPDCGHEWTDDSLHPDTPDPEEEIGTGD